MSFKKIVYFLIASTLILTSCNKDKPEDLKHISDNATFVFTINPKQLIAKSGTKNFSETNIYKNLTTKDSLDMDEDDFNSMMEFSYIFEDPKQSGVDFSKQLFIFGVSNKNGWQTSIAMNFGIADADKFNTLLIKATEKDMDSLIFETNDNIQYLISTKEENTEIIAWNSETAIIYSVTKGYCTNNFLIKTATKLINQSESESLASNKSFYDFYENKKDISIWLNSTFVLNRLPKEYSTVVKMQLPINPIGVEYRYYISFEKGRAIAESQLILPEELKGLIEDFKIIKENFDNDILKYIPKKSFANFSIAINAHEFYRMIKYLYKERQVNIDGAESMAEMAMDIDIERIFTAINGEVVFNIHGIEIDKNNDSIENNCGNPLIFKGSVLVKLENDEVYKAFLKVFNNNKSELIDGYYILNEDNSEIYVSMVNNIMMLTNEKGVIVGFVNNKPQSPSLQDSDIAKHLENYALFGKINLDLSKYDTEIQEYYNNQYYRHDKASLRNKLSEVRLEPIDSYKSTIIMEFKDKDRNSLEVLFSK